MRRGTWIWMAIALVAVAGCHKKQPASTEFVPEFAQAGLAVGSTGDTMTRLANKYSIPIYPNSVPDTSHFSATANMGARVYMAYTVADPPDRVVSFYKGQLAMGSTPSGAVTILTGAARDGSGITINVGQKLDGSGTSYSIVVTPMEQPRYDDTMATNPQAVAAAKPADPYQSPPNPAPKEPVDNTTYYIPTDRAEENTTDDEGNVDGGETGDAGVDDGGNSDQGSVDPPGG